MRMSLRSATTCEFFFYAYGRTMARRYAKKRFARKPVRKFGRRKRGRQYVAKRRIGGAGRRRLYDNRFPVNNAMYSGKPAYVTGTPAPTSAPKRGRVPSGDVVRLGENTSMSACYLGKRTRGMRSMLSATGTGGVKKLYANAVGMHDSTTGVQTNFTVGTLSRVDLNAIKTNLDADLPTEFKYGTNDMKIFFGEVTSRLHLKNQTNHVACVVLYDIIPKRTSDNTTIDTPVEAWTTGLLQQGLASYSTYPGNSPYESKEFQKRFSVVKSTRLYMEPGEQHEHVFVRRLNRVVSSTLFDSSSANAGETIFGLTGYTMVVVYGSIGHFDTDVPTTVSYMPVRLDWIHHLTTQYQFVGVQAKKTAIGVNNIGNAPPAFPILWNHLAASDDVPAGLINA
nr:MAG: capsid protein [Virus sp.]